MREKIQQILIQLRLKGMANILDKELNRAEKKGSAFDASRSLNVLKKNKKGLLIEYQRSFFSGRNLPQQADAVLP